MTAQPNDASPRSGRRRRANGEGTVFQRRDGRWVAEASAPAGSLTPTKRITIYGRTQKEARDKLKAETQALERGRPRPSRVPTLAEYGARHFGHTLPTLVATGHNSPRTVEFYRHLWNIHVTPFLGHHRLTALTHDVLRDWQTNRAQTESTHTGKPLSPRTQQAVYGVLRAVLNEAIRDGLLERNPLSATGVRAPKGERGRPSALSDQTMTTLLRQVDGTWLHALIMLMYLTGARPGEAVGVCWADLDLEAGVWDISRTIARVPVDDGEGTTLGFSEPKTTSSKAPIALPRSAVEVLLEQRERLEQQRSGAERDGRRWAHLDLVFATRAGTPLALGNVLRKLKLQAGRAGVTEDVTLHRLRHTAATALLEEGVSVAVTSKLLRHTRLATTTDIYSHMTERIATEAADALEARFRRLHNDRCGAPTDSPAATRLPPTRHP